MGIRKVRGTYTMECSLPNDVGNVCPMTHKFLEVV
jgi:hypothetical protein